jgi:hypothetical protein
LKGETTMEHSLLKVKKFIEKLEAELKHCYITLSIDGGALLFRATKIRDGKLLRCSYLVDSTEVEFVEDEILYPHIVSYFKKQFGEEPK